LIIVEHQQIELDWCPACKGLWFDADELDLFAESSGRTLDLAAIALASAASGTHLQRSCPRCRKRMEVRDLDLFPPLTVDLCPQGHGIWLDHGELGQLLSELPQSATAPAQDVVSFLGEVFRPADESAGPNSAADETPRE
jgi:Zn-finger nucleic acid-binding protein